MKPRIRSAIFVVVALAQAGVPASMVWQAEHALIGGREYRFRTAPVDPYDAFRGRFVALRFEQVAAGWDSSQTPRRGQTVFASIVEDKDGFARFSRATPQPPEEGDYLAVKVEWVEASNTVRFELPFDRFYLEESIAPKAEQAYRERSRPGQQDAYVILRVRKGRGVIQNLYLGGKPIAEFVREQQR